MKSNKSSGYTISVSIVLYKTSIDEIKKLMNSFSLVTIPLKIIIIDNSPTNILSKSLLEYDIEYIFNPSNPGFGSSHNIAFKKSIDLGFKYHLVVNPDIQFGIGVIESIISEMESDAEIGMIMPKVLNFDSSIQYLPKLLPNPFSIFLRKIKFPKSIYNKFINNYELRFVPANLKYNAPILSGCFTVFNINSIKKIGLYDDKFFMYFEDWDLSRRMHENFKTIYFPNITIYHGYDSGANKSLKLFIIYLKSAFYYFNKWGWFCDKKRKNINLNTLLQFEK
jgi:GT2 family glycosyltransferase